MVRAPCCEKMGLKKGPWTTEEDQILISYIQTYGHGNWRALPKQAGLLRCGKSCRLRWTNYLRPDIKRGNFTREEEEAIINLHGQLGNKWSAIAAQLPGRTDNEIKNVWHTHLKKRVKPKTVGATSAQEAHSGASTSCSSELDGRPSSWAVEGTANDVSNRMRMESPVNPTSVSAPPQPQQSSEFSCSGADSSPTTEFSSDQFADIDPAFWYDAFSMDVTLPAVDAPAAIPERDAKIEFANGFWRDPQQQFPDNNSLLWFEDAQSNGYYGTGNYGSSADGSLMLADGARYGQLDDTDQFWLSVLLDAGRLPDSENFSGGLPDFDG